MFRKSAVALLFLSTSLITENSKSSLAPLFNRIWRVTSSTTYPSSGSIYIFLANGTLLETSCVETYRIATWKADPTQPATIAVTEDGRVAFSATISGATAQTLHLRQTLALGNREVRELDLTAVNKEFVCPDMPK